MAGSNNAIWAALAGNAAIAATKFVAAAATGSASMASEGVHSLVDTINEVLLLHGNRRAVRRPDKLHPYGYGRELYFWAFVVSVLVFSLGAMVSFRHGLAHVLAPEPVHRAWINYVVLAFSFLFEGLSWRIGFRAFHAGLRPGQTPWEALKTAKDLGLLAVLIEDSAALLGLAIAAVGLALSQWLGMPELDGIASMLIGVLLAFAAWALARRSRDLLVGEAADPALLDELLAIAGSDPAILHVNGALTVYLAPDQLSMAMSAEFRDELTTVDIERAVDRIENALRERHPELRVLFVKPQTPETWARRIRDRMGHEDAMR
ncbi:MAG: cation diffusion facilitator family transporter [Thermomonas sp.]